MMFLRRWLFHRMFKVNFCSSPYGPAGAYFRLMHDPTARDPIQTLSWMDNPNQNRSMYHV